MKQLLVSVPAAALAWTDDDVLQVLITEFGPLDAVEVDVRIHPSDAWLPIHMAGGTITRKEQP